MLKEKAEILDLVADSGLPRCKALAQLRLAEEYLLSLVKEAE